MEHLNPPENLPVVPVESEPTEDIHFRERKEDGTLASSPVDSAGHGASAPVPRSLQPIRLTMNESKWRPERTQDDLLSVSKVAERLLVSASAVYRLVKRRRIAFYQLPAGIRFKAADVECYIESRRSEVQPLRSYGRPKVQG